MLSILKNSKDLIIILVKLAIMAMSILIQTVEVYVVQITFSTIAHALTSINASVLAIKHIPK